MSETTTQAPLFRAARDWEKEQYLAGTRTFDGAVETEEGLLIPYTPTERSVYEQLVENTGRHMLDSGDAYGRAWQRNQGRDFDAEVATKVSVSHGYVEVVHNVFHWLVERVTYEPELDAVFEAWAKSESGEVETYGYSGTRTVKRADLPWLQSAETFVGIDHDGPADRDHPLADVALGIYHDGKPFVHNTYNGEDLVSQTLQYVYFSLERDVTLLVQRDADTVELGVADSDEDWEGEHPDAETVVWPAGEYVLLQVHGGCDVRGGYTRPRVYSVSLEDGPSITDNARAYLTCTKDGARLGVEVEGQESLLGDQPFEQPHSWYTDDASNWYDNNGEGELNLTVVDSLEDVPEDWQGTAWAVQDENVVHCPVCFGRLEGNSY